MRKLKCQIGDLAIITDSGILELIGRIVYVTEVADTGHDDWIVTLQGSGIVAPGAFTGVVMLRKRVLMLDSCLMPIRPDSDASLTETWEVDHDHA